MGVSRAPLESILAPIELAHVSRPRSDGQRACVPAPKSSLSDPKSLRAGSWALTEPTCTPPRPSSTGTQMGAHTNVLPRAGRPASPADPLRSGEQPGHSPAALTSSEEAPTPVPRVPDNTQARGSRPRRPGVPRACPHAAGRQGGMGQKPLSLDKEGQGRSLNSESPDAGGAESRNPARGRGDEAGGTGAVGKIQEGVDGEQDEDREGRGERGDRAETRLQTTVVLAGEGGGGASGTGDPLGPRFPLAPRGPRAGGRRVRPGRPPPDAAPALLSPQVRLPCLPC